MEKTRVATDEDTRSALQGRRKNFQRGRTKVQQQNEETSSEGQFVYHGNDAHFLIDHLLFRTEFN